MAPSVQCWHLKSLVTELILLIYKNNFLMLKCKVFRSSKANLNFNGVGAADVTKTDAPYFRKNVLLSLFSNRTVSANGLKI